MFRTEHRAVYKPAVLSRESSQDHRPERSQVTYRLAEKPKPDVKTSPCYKSKATSSFFLSKMIAKLQSTLCTTPQNRYLTQKPHTQWKQQEKQQQNYQLRIGSSHGMSYILNKSETLHLNCLLFIYKMMQASKENESVSEYS